MNPFEKDYNIFNGFNFHYYLANTFYDREYNKKRSIFLQVSWLYQGYREQV